MALLSVGRLPTSPRQILPARAAYFHPSTRPSLHTLTKHAEVVLLVSLSYRKRKPQHRSRRLSLLDPELRVVMIEQCM